MTFHARRLANSERGRTGSDNAVPRLETGSLGQAVDSLNRAAIPRILSSARRRALLSTLCNARSSLNVQTVIGHIADAEYDPTVETSIHQLRQRIHVSLHRTHLPLLEEYGLIEYEEGDGLIVPTHQLERYRSLLDVDEE
ncbi:DUF7344 domain-containing protein [Natronosalvus vescus]|uniref:DUF7344 domain-containing protein n=1 Tax=Natronosalvus vescus TaxID=2953881 RepID=UPI00209195EC|nr:hypothetical protein [Natronosalvus vescus]